MYKEWVLNFKKIMNLERNEIRLVFEKIINEKSDNPFNNHKKFIEMNVLIDSNSNHHATFKMENRKGIVIKTAEESDELFNNNAIDFQNKLMEKITMEI